MSAASGWKSYELVKINAKDEIVSRPFSDAMAGSSERIGARKHMSRVEELGWDDAQKLAIGAGSKKKKQRKRRIVRKDDVIHLLKCTPLSWRLYLYVKEDEKAIIYVHAVSKQRDEEDPTDAATARQRYDGRTVSCGLEELRF